MNLLQLLIILTVNERNMIMTKVLPTFDCFLILSALYLLFYVMKVLIFTWQIVPLWKYLFDFNRAQEWCVWRPARLVAARPHRVPPPRRRPPRSVGCAWHAQQAEYCRKPRYLGIASARGGPCSRASTPPTSDAVLSPEIEYVRRLFLQYCGLPATAAELHHR